MNSRFRKLEKILIKQHKSILGLMSGTSMDGLDMALCQVQGSGTSTVVKVVHFSTIPFDPVFRDQLQAVFCKDTVQLEKVCVLNQQIAKVHADIINKTLKEWHISSADVDVIASHGQTIYHSPQSKRKDQLGNATLQIGDGDHLASLTEIITLSDFRQKHIAAGGEGAPLAAYGDYFCFQNPAENRILLNVGGIANFTFLKKNASPSQIISTDTGPGNTLMDQFIFYKRGLAFDEGGRMAANGKVIEDLLRYWLNHPFFREKLPKTTGQEIFNLEFILDGIRSTRTDRSDEDVMATLNYLTAKSIAETIATATGGEKELAIYISGGGARNNLLCHQLELLTSTKIRPIDLLGVPAGAKEAVLFAVLANETLTGEPFRGATGMPGVGMGKLSFPF